MNMRNEHDLATGRGKLQYRDTRRMIRNYLVPLEPNPDFSQRLRELCSCMGAGELFRWEWESKVEGIGRKGIIIGGAICSALPFVGVAAYAIRKYVLRRRVVPLGI